MKKDRLSIHVENGQSEILEAVTILRNGGVPSQSGLVGITNKTHTSAGSPTLPDTIFNVQATGDVEARFSSLSINKRSKVELLGNGNIPCSGLIVSYQNHSSHPSYEMSRLGHSMTAKGQEISFFVHQSGTTAIGDIRCHTNKGGIVDDLSIVDGRSALLISNSGDASSSGTVALREQANSPLSSADFGKIYVKPYEAGVGTQTQSLFFLDDAGNEFNLAPGHDNSKEGHLYGNQYVIY